jgi:hypothetical protein
MGRTRRVQASKEKGPEEASAPTLDERHRIAVIGFLGVASKRTGLPLRDLPPALLSTLGASFGETSLHCRTIEVRRPGGVDERSLEAECLRLERAVAENGSLFPQMRARKRMRNNYMGLWPLTRRKRENDLDAHKPAPEGAIADQEAHPTRER